MTIWWSLHVKLIKKSYLWRNVVYLVYVSIYVYLWIYMQNKTLLPHDIKYCYMRTCENNDNQILVKLIQNPPPKDRAFSG